MTVGKFKIVMSDLHLGKGRYFRDGTQNILEDFIYDREFADFLYYYRTGPYKDAEVELVLNGDILNLLQIDNWGVHTHLMTERAVVRALKKIIEGHPEFFGALRDFAATPHHSVTYIVGNHDAGMLWPKAKAVFTEAVGSTVTFYDVAYIADGIHIEHGHQYEAPAQIDMNEPFLTQDLPEPVLNLPLGSIYVAVLLPKLKQERAYLDKVRPIKSLFRWLIIHDFTWTIRALWRIGRFIFDTVMFRHRYRIRLRPVELLKLIFSFTAYPNYDKIALKVLKNQPSTHTLIMGHTHILRYRQWPEGKEYFNEGSWNEVTNLELDTFGTTVKLTYAFIEYPAETESDPLTAPKLRRPKTRLKEWRGVWKPETDIAV